MKKYDLVCNFNLADCMETLGIDEGGRVQQFVTNEFKKNVEPFVPLDLAEKYENPGRLIESCRIENDTDVVWNVRNTPYARNLYYHPEYDFQGKGDSETGGVGRGGYWADRYLQNGGLEELENGARRIAKK